MFNPLAVLLGVMSLIVAIGRPSPVHAQEPASTDGDKPGWTWAVLQPGDLEPDFFLVREELLEAPGGASYVVVYERPAGSPLDEPFEAGSTIIVVNGQLGPGDFELISATMMQNRTGLTRVVGAPVGDETHWYAGPWSAPDADDEGQVVVSRQANVVIAVGLMGLPGAVRSDEVERLARLLWERYAGAGLSTIGE